MSNLTDVILRPGFFSGAYTVTRTAVGTVVNGRYTPGATSTLAINASVQPVGSSLKTMPEGYSAEDGRKVYTTTRLVKLPFPDVISIDGEDFAVSHVDGPWNAFDGTHYVVTVVRTATPGSY